MDVNDLKKVFGEIPVEFLTAAEALQKSKNRLVLIIASLIGAAVLGGVAVHYYYKNKKDY